MHFVGSLNFAEIWFAILIVCFVSKSLRLVYLGLKLKNNNNMTVHTLYAMALPVMEFQIQEYKIRKIFAYKSTLQKEIIEF